MSWLKNPDEAYAKSGKMQTEGPRLYEPQRFFVKKGEKRQVVFVDWDPRKSTIEEHVVWVNNRPKYATCTGEAGAPCCTALGREKVGRITYATVIDVDGYAKKDGSKIGYNLSLFGAKYFTYVKLVEQNKELEGLPGVLMIAKRFGNVPMEPTVGGEITPDPKMYGKRGDMAKLFGMCHYGGYSLTELWNAAEKSPEFLKALGDVFALEFDTSGKLLRKVVPFNYSKVLEPLSQEALEKMMSAPAPKAKQTLAVPDTAIADAFGGPSSSSSSSSSSFEDDIPF